MTSHNAYSTKGRKKPHRKVAENNSQKMGIYRELFIILACTGSLILPIFAWAYFIEKLIPTLSLIQVVAFSIVAFCNSLGFMILYASNLIKILRKI